jgi:pantoate--beta-alanine ligase
MKIVRTVASLRQALDARASGALVGFVPTMGALHDGHVALIRAARAACGQVVVSIFVNPKQFNDAGDLTRYPRQESRDTEIADEGGTDILFVPELSEVYPDGLATSLHITGPALGFEGDHRPGHFDGVAIVCLKLFAMVQPDLVFLGQKDAQQVAVLRQLVRDVNLRLELRVVPTVRDLNGLALSSRNARLSIEERSRAVAIPLALAAGLNAYRAGDDPVAAAQAALRGLSVDYVGLATFDGRPTLLIAARAGATRLIDNVPLDEPELAGLQDVKAEKPEVRS